jgi:Peptidase family S51
MPDLLLLSNSRAPGMGFLEHATDAIRGVLGGRGHLLFVPFAGSDPDAYTKTMRQALAGIDVQVTGMHEVNDAARAVREAEAIFVGGGNSFRLLRTLNRLGVLDALRRAVVRDGIPNLGASAGSNLACPSIRTTRERRPGPGAARRGMASGIGSAGGTVRRQHWLASRLRASRPAEPPGPRVPGAPGSFPTRPGRPGPCCLCCPAARLPRR